MEKRSARVERIPHSDLSRHRKALEPTLSQRADAILAWFGLGIALLIFAALFMVAAEWQPGNQTQIAAEYRALRHDAVAMGDWK